MLAVRTSVLTGINLEILNIRGNSWKVVCHNIRDCIKADRMEYVKVHEYERYCQEGERRCLILRFRPTERD